MSAIATREFEESLLRREAELRAFLNAAVSAAVGTADESHEMMDFKDVAAEETRAVVDCVALDQAARELSQVREALARIDEGTYGLCHDCGDPIEEGRLAALPASRYCMSCQSVNERRGRR
ncbi:MAG: TraR/DksA C4-type zinc finger protein [Burkholderiales bacterium]|nr:TraR/DksA C4-type zinc finger protein [Burkholderiales bacterium]